MDYFKLTNCFSYDLYELLSSLVYARAVHPCSKYKTFHEVLPNLFGSLHYAYDQLLDGLAFLGNESEKPVLRDVINQLKAQNNITGKTIHVADKGLNCARNIAFSKKNGDRYFFSKSVKGLPETEKTWVLL